MKPAKWYRLAMGILTLLLAAALIFQTADIWFTGIAPENVLGDGVYAQQIYRTEDIRARLAPIGWAALVWAVLAVIGAIAFPSAEAKGKRDKMKHIEEKHARAARIAVGAAAAVLIALGVWNGGMRDVLIKAINICTECIGLG